MESQLTLSCVERTDADVALLDRVQEPLTEPFDPATVDSHDAAPPAVVLSFDVEEHHRIEAAAGLDIDSGLKTHYGIRMVTITRRLLDVLAERRIQATFFVVGEIARLYPGLVRDIHAAGHEVASHSWDHRRIHHLTPTSFAEDLRRSKDALEQVTGQAVIGYRAPTFSIVRQTGWAIDVLAHEGFRYDSSIFPVCHDRYGIPGAPRVPFIAKGKEHTLLELPPATLQFAGATLPIGGGGYFRLLPLFLMEMALRQLCTNGFPRVATLYFHPWEFDPIQARLPLRRLNAFRTYVGLLASGDKLGRLLRRHTFTRADKAAENILRRRHNLQTYALDPTVSRESRWQLPVLPRTALAPAFSADG
jgi:polysaccharide deacetylase family protein (PEP-CTERM system associated)